MKPGLEDRLTLRELEPELCEKADAALSDVIVSGGILTTEQADQFSRHLRKVDEMQQYLKVKIKTLAAEARIIRHEERRVKLWKREPGEAPHALFFGLKSHRTDEVRREARCSHLAYGYLRGTKYREMEATCHPDRKGPDWENIAGIVKRFGELGHNQDKFVEDNLKEWKEDVSDEN